MIIAAATPSNRSHRPDHSVARIPKLAPEELKKRLLQIAVTWDNIARYTDGRNSAGGSTHLIGSVFLFLSLSLRSCLTQPHRHCSV
jgi:hypothetical protein